MFTPAIRVYCLLVLSQLLLLPATGQEQVRIETSATSPTSTPVTISRELAFSSLVFRLPQAVEASFEVSNGSQVYKVGIDPHYEGPGASSQLIIFTEPVRSVRLQTDYVAA